MIPHRCETCLHHHRLCQSECSGATRNSRDPRIASTSPLTLTSLKRASTIPQAVSPGPPSMSRSGGTSTSMTGVSVAHPSISSDVVSTLSSGKRSKGPLRHEQVLRPQSDDHKRSTPFDATRASSISFESGVHYGVYSDIMYVGGRRIIRTSIHAEGRGRKPTVGRALSMKRSIGDRTPVTPPIPRSTNAVPVVSGRPVIPPRRRQRSLGQTGVFG